MLRFLVVAALFLAGCSGSPQPSAADPLQGPSSDGPDAVQVFTLNGSTMMGGRGTLIPEDAPLRFTTDSSASAIVLELSWDDDVQDLNGFLRASVDPCPAESPLRPVDEAFCVGDDLILDSPGFGAFRDADGDLGAPDNPSHLVVEGEALRQTLQECKDPCEWQSWPESEALHANVSWSLHVSVFRGAVPPGYTALSR